MKYLFNSPAVQGLTRGRLVPLSVGGLFLMLALSILFSGLASAIGPVEFSHYAGRAIECPGDNCMSSPQDLTISVSAGDAVIVSTRVLLCTANTNMGVAISDNGPTGGNSYTQRFSFGTENCGTVDKFFRVHTTLATKAATQISVSITNLAGGDYAVVVLAAAVYTGVASFGNTFSAAFTEGSTAFPWAEVTQSIEGSWAFGTFFQEGAQAIGSMQVGAAAGSTTNSFGSINDAHSTVTGATAGGHDCTPKLCVAPNFGSAHTWVVFGIELAPSPPTPADEILLRTMWGWFGIFLLFMVLALMVAGAYKFRRWRDAD